MTEWQGRGRHAPRSGVLARRIHRARRKTTRHAMTGIGGMDARHDAVGRGLVQ